MIQENRRLPLLLTWDELQALPRVSVETALVCDDAPLTNAHVGQWTGAALKPLLPTVSGDAILSCADGQTKAIPTAHLEYAILAYLQNGTQLTPEQGAPVRLIVPGRSGCHSAKWLRRVEISTDNAPVRHPVAVLPRVTFTSPAQQNTGDVLFTGVAYSSAGVEQVEISADDEDWRPAQIEQEVGGLVRWSAQWKLYQPGDVIVRVRAISNESVSSERPPVSTSIFNHPSNMHEDEMIVHLRAPGSSVRQEWR